MTVFLLFLFLCFLIRMSTEKSCEWVREHDGKVFWPHQDKDCYTSRDGEEVRFLC